MLTAWLLNFFVDI